MSAIRFILTPLAALLAGALAQLPPSQPPAPTPSPAPSHPPAKAAPLTADEAAEATAAAPWSARLSALSPAQPQAYFLLAEEIADAATDPHTRQLATRLYVLAFVLERAAGQHATASSCCLALARLAGNDHDREWLRAMARVVDPRRTLPEWTRDRESDSPENSAYRLATLMGDVRAGLGIAAKRSLADAAVRSALERFDPVLRRLGTRGGLAYIEREANRWPCPECANDRAIKRPKSNEFRLCPVCAGKPGPRLSADELLAFLKFESWLLQGTQRSWAAQLGVDHGAPLYDPIPDELPLVLSIDATKPLWRNSRWVQDPNAPAPASQKPESKKPGPDEPDGDPPEGGPNAPAKPQLPSGASG
jgi:hypothetical protein